MFAFQRPLLSQSARQPQGQPSAAHAYETPAVRAPGRGGAGAATASWGTTVASTAAARAVAAAYRAGPLSGPGAGAVLEVGGVHLFDMGDIGPR